MKDDDIDIEGLPGVGQMSDADGQIADADTDPMQELRDMTRQALDDCDGERRDACNLLRKRILDNNTLFRALMMPAFEDQLWRLTNTTACYTRRNNMISEVKREAWENNNPPTVVVLPVKDTGAGVSLQGMKAMAARNWFDYQLVKGMKLGDATIEDLDKSIQYYRNMENSFRERADFLQAIKNGMKGKRPVRKQYKLEDLEKFAQEFFADKDAA